MSATKIIRWNLGLIIAVGLYGLITDEPYWRENGHGPWLYDYLFWFGLVLNGPSGFAADYLSWLVLRDGEGRGNRPRQLFLHSLGLLVTAAGGAAAYQAWLFGHRPSGGVFIDKYFWFVRVAGLACAGAMLLAYAHFATKPLTEQGR